MTTKTNNNKNKVGYPTMKRHGEKCTLLTERSQYEKITYYSKYVTFWKRPWRQ